jgi:hypothetical protein
MSNLKRPKAQDRVPPGIRRHLRIVMPVLGILAAVGATATPESLLPNWQSRVSSRVINLTQASNSNSINGTRQSSSSVRYDAKGRLQIDIRYDCTQPAPRAAAAAAGMVMGTMVKIPPLCVIEGWAPVASVPTLASLPSVRKIDLPQYSKRHPPISPRSDLTTLRGAAIASASNGTPAIDGNGVTIMNADKYVQQTEVTGAGVTIGVISDDVTSLAVIQGRGELPAGVDVVQPSANPTVHMSLTDEGTMMLEEVYAVAPGAKLAFCGPETFAEYLDCLQNLIAAGATVISDDLGFAGGDVMSAPAQNQPALAIESILTGNPNVMLYHSVGNDALDYWQGAYLPIQSQGGGTCTVGQSTQTDNYFQQFGTSDAITWNTDGGNDLLLASVVPAAQTTPNNFDLYLVDSTTSQVVACSTAAASDEVDGSTSYTVIEGSAIPPGTYYIYVGTTAAATSPSDTLLKLIGTDDGGGKFALIPSGVPQITSGAPDSPQAFAAGVSTVGAVDGDDGVGNTIETYSDTGPIQLEMPMASTLQAPLLVAPDGIYVDDIGTDFQASGGMFYGTSAASPNTAAVAVLLRSAFPSLTPTQITGAITTGASALGASAPNGTFGYGRVDAVGALATLAAPTITAIANLQVVGGTNSGPLAFTLGGTGALTVTSSSDNTTLVAAGSQAITISPSCGTSMSSCNVTVSPTLGHIGTAHITIKVADGANRSTSMQFTVTVIKPAPPTVSVMTGASQSIAVGGMLTPVTLTIAGTQTLSVAVTSSNATLLPVSSITLTQGCGPTVSACTATLSVASGQSGSSTVTITATDPYSQSGVGSATVTVNAPSKGGGGSLDLVSVIGLGCLLLLRAIGRKLAKTRRDTWASPWMTTIYSDSSMHSAKSTSG